MPGSTTAPNPERRPHRAGTLLLFAALAGVTAARAADSIPAQAAAAPAEAAPESAPAGVGSEHADTGVPWLREVRAQRQAIEERRRANRAAFAAQREAWEDRREARRARLERDWAARQVLHAPPADPARPPTAPDAASLAAPSAAAQGPAAPPDWNNVWYFRGY